MRYILSFIALALMLSANGLDNIGKKGSTLPYEVLKVVNKVEIRQGGYGSSIFKDLNNKNRFYGLTDKGVNGYDIKPTIAHFQIQSDGKISLISKLQLKTKINPEGLVVLNDGSFWVSDEFGPDIIHFDKNANEIERIDFLPRELKKRRKNHGFEGLAITPDGKTLVALMQSSLQNPNKKVNKSKLTRIISLNLEKRSISQYIYKQEKNKNSNSEIRAISNTTFLVIERDSKNPLKSKKSHKRVYKISLENATDIEKISLNTHLKQDKNIGLLIDGKTLEQTVLKKGWKYLKKHNIYPVKKSLVVDLIKELNYSHDKPEGLWIVDKNSIAILNDDDFGVRVKNKKLKQKYLNKKNIDMGTLYIIRDLSF